MAYNRFMSVEQERAQWYQTRNYLLGDTWGVPTQERAQYSSEFETYRRYNKRPLTRVIFAELYRGQRPRDDLYESRAFQLADYDRKGYLDAESYTVACHLLSRFSIRAMPATLPPELIPPSKRHYHLWGAQEVSVMEPEESQKNSNQSFIRNGPTAAFKPYGALSNELWIMILNYLSQSTLREVCQVSKRFQRIGIPSMYNKVSINAHLKPQTEPDTNGRISKVPDPHHIIVQQYRFIKQILRKPVYGSYVRTFQWTMGLIDHFELPYWIDDEQAVLRKGEVYSMFSHLDSVTFLDIYTGSTNEEPVRFLPFLFPKARSIRLRGTMHYALACSILHGPDKAPLDSLALENVLEGEPYSYEDDFHRHFKQPVIWTAETIRAFEEWHVVPHPTQVGPGNMRRIMTPELQARCQKLQHLSLTKIGRYDRGEQKPGFLDGREDEVYQEWATFIDAVRPKTLAFAHQRLNNPIRGQSVSHVSPMNELFRDFILPVLRNGWQGLEKLELRGVQLSFFSSLKAGTKTAEVVIDEHVEFSGVIW